MTDKQWLIACVAEELNADPEYLFARNPDTAVFRHKSTGKWFAAILSVNKQKLGLPEDEICDIVDLKCGPIMSAAFRSQQGVFPGYHMNKEHWISVLLDGSVEEEQLRQMLRVSYDLTGPKPKKKQVRKRNEQD